MKVEFGEYIYRDLEKNSYLINLYTNLLKQYTRLLFGIESINQDININDLLKFADLLSKSTNNQKNDWHKNIAQTIVVLLSKIYPDNESVQKMLYSVLYTINNYRGITDENYYYADIREFVTKYIEKNLYKIDDKSDNYFVRDQKEIFDTINSQKYFSYSGPTSMGKTFIMKTFIIKQILNNRYNNYVIVVPTKALIAEITSEIINDLGEGLKEHRYKVVNSYNEINEEDSLNYIMIYTQERFLMHLLNLQTRIDYVFIDEAHKIFYSDKRSMYFYKIIDILNNFSSMPSIFFSAPLIENPDEFLKLLPNTVERSSKVYRFSPVCQQKYIIDYKENNIRLYNDLTKNFIELDYNDISEFDICDIIKKLGNNSNNIIYCDSKDEAIDWAQRYAKSVKVFNNGISNTILEEVKKYIADEIHKDYYLIKTLDKGVAYHLGYVPNIIRKHIESLYKNKYIDTIFCTSTLLEGVNLPADNLFIPIKEKSNVLKNDIDFKNLIGRVGRIKYNLVGNVYIIPKSSDNPIKKCSDIIQEDISNKKLSIDSFLTNARKKEIIVAIKEGKTVLKKKKSFDEFNFSRYIMNALIYDIKNDYHSNIYKQFSELISEDDRKMIKERFQIEKVPQDMPVTTDQIATIDNSISEGLLFPSQINYDSILSFLEQMYDRFNWKNYESGNDIGNKNRLKYYAVILNLWMNGFSIKQIIESEIENQKNRGYIYKGRTYVEFNGDVSQINVIINETLDTLENVVLFKISNYFMKFSERIKYNMRIDNLDNDWYEYLQYGTKEKEIIELQKNGFSRDIALKIKKYVVQRDGKTYISKDILNDNNKMVIEEANEIFLNNNTIFVD